MNLPNVLSELIKAQDNFDSTAYANCFAEGAVVFDEGTTHNGPGSIRQWNEKTNAQYQAKLEPIGFTTNEKESMLTTKVSGTFEGSPIVLNYHFELNNGKITALKITG